MDRRQARRNIRPPSAITRARLTVFIYTMTALGILALLKACEVI